MHVQVATTVAIDTIDTTTAAIDTMIAVIAMMIAAAGDMIATTTDTMIATGTSAHLYSLRPRSFTHFSHLGSNTQNRYSDRGRGGYDRYDDRYYDRDR